MGYLTNLDSLVLARQKLLAFPLMSVAGAVGLRVLKVLSTRSSGEAEILIPVFRPAHSRSVAKMAPL